MTATLLTTPLVTAATSSTTTSFISGVGHVLPHEILSNGDIEKLVETSDDWIRTRTGIVERRKISGEETPLTLGVEAGRRALASAGVTSVDAVICATSSSGCIMPSTASWIHEALNLPPCPAFDLNAACSGFVYALAVADSLVRSKTSASVLVIATEAMTKLVNYTDRATCVLFGDGAGACVVSCCDQPGEAGIRALTWSGDGREARLIHYQGPEEVPQPGIRMAGRGTYRHAVDRLCTVMTDLVTIAGWDKHDVLYVPHQANLRIMEAAAHRLGVSMDQVVTNVDRVGNTGAASIPIALAEAVASGRLKRGDRVITVAFGAGATWGGVALDWACDTIPL